MTALRNYIDDLSNPVFLLDESGDNIIFSNRMASAEHGFEQDAKLQVSDTIKFLQIEPSGQTLSQFNHKWYSHKQEKVTLDGDDIQILGLHSIRRHPDEQTLNNWKNMIAVLLHRLRSPLTGISGYVDLLEEENENEKLSSRFSSIDKGFNHVFGMMDELEELYNIDVHYNADDFSPVHIPNFVESLLSGFEEEKQSRLQIDENSASKCIVDTNRSFLRKILLHLLDNSFVHSEGKIHLKISSQNNGSIHISNNNAGLTDEIKSTLFHPFVTSKANKLGIGLTMVLLYTQKLGGIVYMVEKKDQLTFVLQFPVK